MITNTKYLGDDMSTLEISRKLKRYHGIIKKTVDKVTHNSTRTLVFKNITANENSDELWKQQHYH